jgi:N-acetylglucosamine kinase-like BadF-type ATPase
MRRLEMEYLLGVDGGGTKMLGALARLDGKVIKTAKTGPASYHAVGIETVEKNLGELLGILVGRDYSSLKACCLGFSGCGRPSDYDVLNPMLKRVGIFEKTYLTGDMAIGLMGGALEPKGIIVIAGTGSIVYGIGDDGVPKRAGGYGQWFADEGSGYRIGHKGLCAIMKASDGRIKPVTFEQPVLNMLGLKAPNELILWATGKNKEGTIKTDMAAVAPFIIAAAEKRDRAAMQILHEEVSELVLAVKTVRKGLKFKKMPKVILVGGVVENNPFYFKVLKNAIRKAISGIQVTAPKAAPAVGAVIGAAQKAGLPITSAFIRNVTASWEALENK